ncbi:MAG: response regulator receiver protein [Bacteroidetes bacterium]|nr:MAG: response regulator receiver protein [Bacteroidota bacterium]
MKTILLIESNSNILENLAESFEMEGYNVLTASNGNAGVELAGEFVPDLIVSEVLLGKMNGYEVLRLLLDKPKTSDIPFIFSTTKSEKRDRTLALELGADDYIVKPYAIEPLFAMAIMWIKSGTHRCPAT